MGDIEPQRGGDGDGDSNSEEKHVILRKSANKPTLRRSMKCNSPSGPDRRLLDTYQDLSRPRHEARNNSILLFFV
jgi:hypothetical protein